MKCDLQYYDLKPKSPRFGLIDKKDKLPPNIPYAISHCTQLPIPHHSLVNDMDR